MLSLPVLPRELGQQHFNVLKYLQEKLESTAIIAGGACRDLVLNRPYKDIDILMSLEKRRSQNWAKFIEYDMPKALSFGPKDFYKKFRGDEDEDGEYSNPGTMLSDGVDELFFRGDTYQIITVRGSVTDFVQKKFDAGLNKIYHTGEKLVRTPEFDRDFNSKSITIDPAEWSQANFSRVMKSRVPKLKEMFPDYKVVVLKENLKEPVPFSREEAKISPSTSIVAGESVSFDMRTGRVIERHPQDGMWRYVIPARILRYSPAGELEVVAY